MTQRKKVVFVWTVVLALLLTLVCTAAFAVIPTADAAPPVVEDMDTWENTYNGSYYDNLNTNLTGISFRKELASLITTTHTYNPSYDALKNLYKTTDADPDNSGNVIWFYTGTSAPYTGAMDSGNYPTNREHVWPKQAGDAFPEKSDAGSDAHHLRPLNTALNNTRNNHQFGEVAQTTSNRVLQSGSASNYGTSDPDTWCYLSGNKFYPAKGYRGATARILFYVQTRWGDQYKLKFVTGEGYSKTIGDVATLLKWHLEEPPTDQEIRRNNAVANIQGNRNPFIDHPEYAEMIYCYDGGNYNNALQKVVEQYGGYLDNINPKPVPTDITLSSGDFSLNVGSSKAVSATVTPSDANSRINWKSNKTSVATVNNGVITGVSEGTATITATSAVNSAVSASLTVTVTEPEVQSLTVTPASLTLTQGGTRQLTVTASPSGASNAVGWSSSNTAVATVGANGLVTAVSEGEATITATSSKNPNVTATVTVKVVSQQVNTQDFNSAMTAIESSTTLQQRYDAIKRAIDAYNNMDASSKEAVQADYDKLRQAITQYNQDIASYNEEFASATQFTSQVAAVSVSAVFLAIAVIVSKRLGR